MDYDLHILKEAFLSKYGLNISDEYAREILGIVSLRVAIRILRKCRDDVERPTSYFKRACENFLREIKSSRNVAPRPANSSARVNAQSPPGRRFDLDSGADLGAYQDDYLAVVENIDKTDPESDSWEPDEELLKYYSREFLLSQPPGVRKAIAHAILRLRRDDIA